MKRLIAFTLAAIMLLMLTACPQQEKPPPVESADPTLPLESLEPSAIDDSPEPAPVSGEEPSSDTPETISGVYTLSDYVVVDDENCTLTIRSAYEDEYRGFTIKVLCVNKSEKNLQFTWNGVSVNGYMLDPYWYSEVAAGKKANSEISFYQEDFTDLGITTADEITFTLVVYDSDDWLSDNLIESEYTVYPTQPDAAAVVYPERKPVTGEQIITDSDDITFIVESMENDPLWGTSLICYIENKTAEPLTFTWNNTSVNGYMLEPYWAQDVYPGKRAYVEVTFYEEDLKRNDITEIEEVEFTLYVTSADDWTAQEILNEIFTYTP